MTSPPLLAVTSPTAPGFVKWAVLGVFMLIAGLSQALWLNFAPLLTLVQSKYAVSEGVASTLLLAFPLVYVLLSVPAGRLTDRRGYVFAVGASAVVMALFACLRIVDGGFGLLLFAQVGIAAAQPFAVNGISKLVGDWFPADQSALATGLGTLGMFLGMAVGMAATPPLVEALGYQGSMVVFAAVSATCAAAFLLVARRNPASPANASPSPVTVSTRSLLAQGELLQLFLVAALGLGFFNGLTTWIEPILAPNGFDAVKAGAVGGVLIGGGLLGAIVVPALADHFRARKPFLLASVALSMVTLAPVCTSHDETTVMVSAFALGFCFLPAFALLLDSCATVAGEAAAGSATGLLMLFGNAGGVVVIVAMVAVKGDAPTFERAVMLLFGVLALAFLLALRLRETATPRARA